MKLEKYTKQTGPYFRPMYREVQEDSIVDSVGQRDVEVSEIVVEITLEAGGTYSFQGDEVSQDRLARYGWGMDKTNYPAIQWRTVDDQIVLLTTIDMANILLKAGEAQSAIWFQD